VTLVSFADIHNGIAVVISQTARPRHGRSRSRGSDPPWVAQRLFVAGRHAAGLAAIFVGRVPQQPPTTLPSRWRRIPDQRRARHNIPILSSYSAEFVWQSGVSDTRNTQGVSDGAKTKIVAIARSKSSGRPSIALKAIPNRYSSARGRTNVQNASGSCLPDSNSSYLVGRWVSETSRHSMPRSSAISCDGVEAAGLGVERHRRFSTRQPIAPPSTQALDLLATAFARSYELTSQVARVDTSGETQSGAVMVGTVRPSAPSTNGACRLRRSPVLAAARASRRAFELLIGNPAHSPARHPYDYPPWSDIRMSAPSRSSR